jgi:hypothetical protein
MEAKPATIDVESTNEDVVTLKPIKLLPAMCAGSHDRIARAYTHSV